MLTLQFVAFLGAAVLVPTGVILLGLGMLRSDHTADLTDDGLVPHLVRRPLPADHRSTEAERQECRARLGANYDTHLVIVADILARRPAALSGVLMESQDLPIDDLVTVSAYLTGPPMVLDRALRKGTADLHRAVIACVTSGLHRFPPHRGACYGVARTVGIPLDVYLPGRTIIEPAFIRAEAQRPWSWSTGLAAPDTEIIFAFWSRTGRQVGSLTASPDTVLFAAGTRFRVIDVQPSAGDRPGVVFLGECRKFAGFAREWQLARLGFWNWLILTQLRRELTTAPQIAAEADLRPPAELGFTPGFDQTGRPYQEELARRALK